MGAAGPENRELLLREIEDWAFSLLWAQTHSSELRSLENRSVMFRSTAGYPASTALVRATAVTVSPHLGGSAL